MSDSGNRIRSILLAFVSITAGATVATLLGASCGRVESACAQNCPDGPAGPAGADGVAPTGAVVHFATACPPGWLLGDGSTQTQASYPELFAAIGTAFGPSTDKTFTLPELRGEFVRGADNGRGVDPGRALGSTQAEDFKSFSMQNNRGPSNAYNHGPILFPKAGMNGSVFGGFWSSPAGLIGIQWDSSEIRPRNVALQPCIKT